MRICLLQLAAASVVSAVLKGGQVNASPGSTTLESHCHLASCLEKKRERERESLMDFKGDGEEDAVPQEGKTHHLSGKPG